MNANPNVEAFGPWYARGRKYLGRQGDKRTCRDRRSVSAWSIPGGTGSGRRSLGRNCRTYCQLPRYIIVYLHQPSPSTHAYRRWQQVASGLFLWFSSMDLTAGLSGSGPHHHGGIFLDIQCVSALLLKRPRNREVRVTRSPFTDWATPWTRWVPRHFMSQLTLWTSPVFRLLRLSFVLAAESRREHAVSILQFETNVITATRRCRYPSRAETPEDPDLYGRRGKPRTCVRKRYGSL